MTTGTSNIAEAPRRAYALDALRGLAILGMILSGQMPFGENALPAWMYHAQVPPPEHKWVATIAGITWVDLVFPFFFFALGAAIPLALSRRLEQGGTEVARWLCLSLSGACCSRFSPSMSRPSGPMSSATIPPSQTWLIGLLGFALVVSGAHPAAGAWPAAWRWGIRVGGWVGAVALLALLHYPDGKGFSLGRSDIIIVVLANMAVFGSLLWWLTRDQPAAALGVLGVLVAIRLSNMPHPIEGWVSDIWRWSPVPWMYQLYYLQYLFIVVPGTIAGDLLLRGCGAAPRERRRHRRGVRLGLPFRYAGIALLMLSLTVLLVAGLKARWLVPTTLITFALCAAGLVADVQAVHTTPSGSSTRCSTGRFTGWCWACSSSRTKEASRRTRPP